MGVDSSANIAREVFIDDRSRVGRQQGNALFDGSARRLWRVQHGNWVRIIFNDDFSAGADVGHQTGEIADRFCLRNVDRRHTDDDNAESAFRSAIRRLGSCALWDGEGAESFNWEDTGGRGGGGRLAAEHVMHGEPG